MRQRTYFFVDADAHGPAAKVTFEVAHRRRMAYSTAQGGSFNE